MHYIITTSIWIDFYSLLLYNQQKAIGKQNKGHTISNGMTFCLLNAINKAV
jgi:hypothetical protein